MVLGMPNLTARLSENYHRFNVLIFRAAQSLSGLDTPCNHVSFVSQNSSKMITTYGMLPQC
jgi:hypothetical protein